MAVERPFKAAVIVLETDQWKDVKDLMDMGFEHAEQTREDEAYLEMLARTWSQIRSQLETFGVNI